MKRLFLASSFADVTEIFEKFTNEKIKGKTVTFISTASIPEEVTFYVDDDKKAFEELGIIVHEFNVTEHSGREIANTLDNNDYIFVSGGNTFYLLQELKNTGADKIIAEQIKKGKIYIGASAGSIIMAPSIEYVDTMDDRTKAEKLNKDQALGIVDFHPLPHYTNPPFETIVEDIIREFEDRIDLIPISNTQAIEVKGDNFKVVGK
ncbi:MAG: Type 1 glutamine amidotransferase-like domain-containing protein [Methanolobus sp.]|nr:Type 1 glutamine amidotransferase-like domain-containing protein [Methanolobus sp.]